MILKVYKDNGETTQHVISKENLCDITLKNKVSFISSHNKEQNALDILKSFHNDAKSILFDQSNKVLLKRIQDLNIKEFCLKKDDVNIFSNKDFAFTYFTSGSTGLPTAALKTKDHILEELKETTKILKKYKIKRVIVTVPFIHFYGSLLGLFYPLLNDLDIVLKEHFLPNDLLDLIDDNSLVVSTPLYIKSLNRLQRSKNLSTSLFVSSTAPLTKEDTLEFNKKFSCDIFQLFGSTETGGFAYKFNNDEYWTKFNQTQISTNKENELKIKSPFISNTIYTDDFLNTNQEIQTLDYVEIQNDKFKVLGRSSKIFKVAGKRYSTIEIENILEKDARIDKALVFVKTTSKSLRGEALEVIIESTKFFLKKDIQILLKNELSNIKFEIELKIVKEIPLSSVGKKIRV